MSIIFTTQISVAQMKFYFHGPGLSAIETPLDYVKGLYKTPYFKNEFLILSGDEGEADVMNDWFVFVLRHDDGKRFVRDRLFAPLSQRYQNVYVRRNLMIRDESSGEYVRSDVYIVNVGISYAKFAVIRHDGKYEFYTNEYGRVVLDDKADAKDLPEEYPSADAMSFCEHQISSRELSSRYWGEVFPK